MSQNRSQHFYEPLTCNSNGTEAPHLMLDHPGVFLFLIIFTIHHAVIDELPKHHSYQEATHKITSAKNTRITAQLKKLFSLQIKI